MYFVQAFPVVSFSSNLQACRIEYKLLNLKVLALASDV